MLLLHPCEKEGLHNLGTTYSSWQRKSRNHEAIKVIRSARSTGINPKINCLTLSMEEFRSLFHPACLSVRRRQFLSCMSDNDDDDDDTIGALSQKQRHVGTVSAQHELQEFCPHRWRIDRNFA